MAHTQHVIPVVAGVVQLRPDAAAAAGDGQSVLVGDLSPLVVVRAANDTAELVGEVGGDSLLLRKRIRPTSTLFTGFE